MILRVDYLVAMQVKLHQPWRSQTLLTYQKDANSPDKRMQAKTRTTCSSRRRKHLIQHFCRIAYQIQSTSSRLCPRETPRVCFTRTGQRMTPAQTRGDRKSSTSRSRVQCTEYNGLGLGLAQIQPYPELRSTIPLFPLTSPPNNSPTQDTAYTS